MKFICQLATTLKLLSTILDSANVEVQRGQRALVGVASNFVERTNAPPYDQAGKARTNVWYVANGYANQPSLRSSDFCRQAEIRTTQRSTDEQSGDR